MLSVLFDAGQLKPRAGIEIKALIRIDWLLLLFDLCFCLFDLTKFWSQVLIIFVLVLLHNVNQVVQLLDRVILIIHRSSFDE